MTADQNNGRLHDPSLRELTAELDGLRSIVNERHSWYSERDKDRQMATDKALAAAEKKVDAAFADSEKAITKAEDAQRAYNASHNDLSRKLEEQNKATMPRTEIENRFGSIQEKIALLTGSFTTGSGMAEGAKAAKDDTRANIALFISVVGIILAIVMFFVGRASGVQT